MGLGGLGAGAGRKCVGHVTTALQAVKGAETVRVSLASNTAAVTGPVDVRHCREAIEDAGYGVVPPARSVVINIEGMTCEYVTLSARLSGL